ncbi:uncharacterized protein UTRI_00975_B [Ustilago trichophora]|uniref:Uncharacterized protein n=1 Tax=Ustilago trichophora TaxID=86804 RepID=A0A5C3DT47_9BASI|nr:uncharacterized protein UTRI_00975_B [Ustilago trichophora]
MDNHTTNTAPAQQQAAQPFGSQQRQAAASSSSLQQFSTLPSETQYQASNLPTDTTPGFTWAANPALTGLPNDLPPRYDSHQFPPTPPALRSSDQPGSYFDLSHHLPSHHTPPAQAPWSPSEQPPRHFASRFPRWGTWLEKRALERHYAQLELQHLAQQQSTPHASSTPSRKKSWGAWVNDPDAINDDDSASTTQERLPTPHDASLPPLHLRHFGSRFIPHLPAQPLCSILVELPPPPPRQHASLNPPMRQVLLIGTAQGLFAVQFRDPRPSFSDNQPHSSPSSPSASPKQWNDTIRCIPIWTGLAIYQMCVLASKDDPAASSNHISQTSNTPSSGVFLALTCPSSARDGFLTSSLMQLSAHAGSVLESVAASGTFASSSSTSSHNSHGISDSNEGVAAANFGATAGGGPGRAVPPGGTGVVRMWHLQAIRELLVYALDRNDAQVPINLATASSSSADRRSGFGTILKKTFSRQKVRPGDKAATHARSSSSTSLSATLDPLPRPDGHAMSASHSQQSMRGSSDRTASSPREQVARRRATQDFSNHDHRKSVSPQTSPPSTKRQPDSAHTAAISLASSSVPIQPPSHSNAASHGNNPSLTSIFADDLIQSFSGSRPSGTKGKDRDTGTQAASKGVLFFSVHEAGADTKGSGTWYLAITYARSVMVYEASKPRRGSSRAWSFVKELYAPFPIKAVAFAPAAVSDDLHPFTGLGPLAANAGPTKLRVASAEGPLLTSKKVSYRDRDHPIAAARESGGSSPVNVPRGSAAPSSWHKADLCLLLSFGRRAVLVRLRDSHVREMDLKPLSRLLNTATAEGTDSTSATQLSLQPHPLTGPADHHSRHERSRPLSMTGDGLPWADGPLPGGSGRTNSMEQRLREAILDKRSNKHNWVGFSSIEARIFVRQWSEAAAAAAAGHVANNHTWPQRQDSLGLSPMGLSMVKASSTAASQPLVGVDTDLPRVPAHQNASFDRRMSRLHLSEQSSHYHDELQAEDSSDSDDDDGDIDLVDRREEAAKYRLTDPGPLPQTHSRSDQATPTQARYPCHVKSPNRSFSLPLAEPVSAKLALASRSAVTHVMQLPLAADLAQAAPLAVMQWSDTPNAVSGWARVLGIERASSKGTTPLSHLKQSSTTSVSSDTPGGSFGDPRSTSFNARRKNNKLVLHIGVTCVAFLASRIESRKVSFKMSVEVDFDLCPESELELIPLVPDKEYNRSNGTATGMHASAEVTPTETGEIDDDATSLGDGWRAASASAAAQGRRHTFAYPSVVPHVDRASEASAISQELEYLCAPLLTLHPIDLDLRSCGSQSLFLPFSHSSGQGGKAQAESSSAAHALFPELAGDAGVVAFDWRGADDFRIFTVGIAG